MVRGKYLVYYLYKNIAYTETKNTPTWYSSPIITADAIFLLLTILDRLLNLKAAIV